ncbi:hypothetical protein BKA83DRAFT_4129534 [Pisolithus microcarpus]|nr:hypothetical protein BKA83DRAFT_4129534 [Pisolithus microcarpus]
MDPLWLSLSCMSDGMPCISSIIYLETSQDPTLHICQGKWPVLTHSAYPEVCSRQSMLLNFGLPQFNAYHAIFHVKHDHSICVYETNIHMLVQSSVNALLGEVDPIPDDHDVTIHLECAQALEAWTNLKDKILGYEHQAHTYLVWSVMSDTHDLMDGLPKSIHSPKSVQWFTGKIISATKSGATQPCAPFSSGGGALAVMPVVLSKAKCHLDTANMDSEVHILDLLVHVLNKLQIMNVPWSHNPTPGPGCPPSTVIYDSWVNLGSHHFQGHSGLMLIGPSQRHVADATQSSTITSEKDCYAPWSVNDLSIQDLYCMLNHSTLPQNGHFN